ncbi:hypothetical protein E1B28_006022 [Marasmius oreades]|uniref:RING-type domain-containing protein n=1 Tax=Marasmius oreades TaxID=181124 RepID=A0A9P7S6X5_9AGAR|nr:uncharacterized protein E1B28_006022 [Marasmius oreades]KAG7095248.1 hypothetical protein E1B28_006022 [Marasmius oreades]
MLCLSTGAACDVCLDPFGGELKAPSVIECGHVFCVDCLEHITRACCPLCRTPYDPRRSIKIHIDIDPSTQRVNESRPFFDRIAKAANEGSDEVTVKNLIDDCLAFLKEKPRTQEFEDLRVTVRMINYLHTTKTNLRQQKRKAREDASRMQEEIARMQGEFQHQQEAMLAEIETLKGVELGLLREVAAVRADYISVRKVNDSLQEQLKLHTAARNDVSKPVGLSGVASNDSPATEDIKLKGFGLMDDGYFLSPLPDFEPGKLFLSPNMESEPLSSEGNLAIVPLSEPPMLAAKRPPLPTPPSSTRSPSLLSMTAPENTRPAYHQVPIPPTSNSSPSPIRHASDPITAPAPSQPGDMSALDVQEQVLYRPTGTDHLRSRFIAIMHDCSPTISSSMPNLTDEHFLKSPPTLKEKPILPHSSVTPPTSKPSTSRSLDSSSFGQSSSPHLIPLPPVKPIATVTPSSSYSQASLAAAAMEDARRQKKVKEGERRRKDSEISREGQDTCKAHAGSPPQREKALESKPGNDNNDVDRYIENSHRPSRKQSLSGPQSFGPSLFPSHQQSSSASTPSPFGSHGQQDPPHSKTYEGWSSSTRPTSSSKLNPSTSQHLKSSATIGSTAPREPPTTYKPSPYTPSSLGTSKGKMAASAMLSNQTSLSVA